MKNYFKVFAAIFMVATIFCLVGCGGSGGSSGSVNPLSTESAYRGVVRGQVSGEGDLSGIPVFLINSDAKILPTTGDLGQTLANNKEQPMISTTDQYGKFFFENVPEGRYNILARQSLHQSALMQNVVVNALSASELSTTEIILRITGTGDVSGQVAVPSGFSTLGLAVFVTGTSYSAYTDANGMFKISGVPVGTYNIAVTGLNLATHIQENVGVTSGQVSNIPLITLTKDISPLNSIIWKGTQTAHPDNPEVNWAYYNSVEGKSYIFDGTNWQTLAINGTTGPQGPSGVNGVGIVWKGSLMFPPENPEINWGYYNFAEGKSYIYDGTAWQILAQDGGIGNIETTAFITKWDTTKTSDGSSANNQVKLPLVSNGTYNFTINWGDGTGDTITSYDQAQVTHTYAEAGEYRVTIVGQIYGWSFNNTGDKEKILDVIQFGNMRLGNYGSYFAGCKNLTMSATDKLDLTGTTNFKWAFEYCESLTTAPSMKKWDTSGITNMWGVFLGAIRFNQDISAWDVSNVTDMTAMFYEAKSFNQPIGNWNVGNVTTMMQMFCVAESFNQGLGSWDVSSVTDMSSMFNNAINFNQGISGWDVSNVTNMGWMFKQALNFNQSLAGWNVGNVTDMSIMFDGARDFNGHVGFWNVSKVTNMTCMFRDAINFDQDIGNWNVSSVATMTSMFYGAKSFNQDISNWNVSNVTDMTGMFAKTRAFQQKIGSWDVSNVTNMSQMFYDSSFNQDIGSWNVSNVTDMSMMFWEHSTFNQDISGWNIGNVTNLNSMFSGASSFNQNLGSWDVSKVTDMLNFLTDATSFSTANYDALLTGWAPQTVQSGVTLHVAAQYSAAASAARATLAGKGWTINDGGQAP